MNSVQKLLNRWFKKKAQQRYIIQNGRLVSINDNQEAYIKNGYNVNDIVYAVVNVQLDKVRLAPWSLYKVVDKSSLKKCYALQRKKDLTTRDLKEIKELWKKSLEPVKNPGQWGKLLTYPNNEETFGDFVAKGCGYKLLTGNKYVWADILQGGADSGIPNSLHVIPSQFVQITATDGFPGRVTGYDLYSIGMTKKAKFPVEEVMHEKYPGYDFSVSGEHHYGQSPLRSAVRRVNRSNSAIEAATAKFQNGGLDAIIFNDTPDMPIEVALEQANLLKKSLIHEYTGPKNQGKVTSSPYKVGAIQLGLSPVDLQIIESEKWDQVMIASVYGVPPELIGHTGTKTYDNIKTAEKALTNRCALPLLTSFRDTINRKAHSDWGLSEDMIIDFDSTVYSELQEDVGEKVAWVEKVAKMTGIPVNRILELVGLETIDEPEYEMPRITPEMGEFLEDWRLSDVDNALNDNPEDIDDDV